MCFSGRCSSLLAILLFLSQKVLRADGVTHAYDDSEAVFRDVDLRVPQGEVVAIIGPSGVGKTTLLRLLAGIVQPQAGTVRVGEFEMSEVDDAQLRAFRIQNIGFVFQDFRLIDYLDVRENIRLP